MGFGNQGKETRNGTYHRFGMHGLACSVLNRGPFCGNHSLGAVPALSPRRRTSKWMHFVLFERSAQAHFPILALHLCLLVHGGFCTIFVQIVYLACFVLLKSLRSMSRL